MTLSRFRFLTLFTLACVMAEPAVARRQAVQLPRSAPVPEMLAERATQPEVALQPETPTPVPRPDEAQQPASPPGQAPVPEARPPENEQKVPEKTGDKQSSPQSDPRSDTVAAEKMPAGEAACRTRLHALNAAFEDEPAKQDATAGCSMPYPLSVTSLSNGIELAPKAELNCAMAEAIARFTVDIVQPAARSIMGRELAGISHASAYVCRQRHSGTKLSEHAFGNALDIASFTFRDGSSVEVGPNPGEKQGKFLDHIRKAACGPFKTVLGPGSDPDHETHLHLDLAPRRNGSTFCQ